MLYQIVYRGIIFDNQGYSKAAREYILALDRKNIDVKVIPLDVDNLTVNLDGINRIRELIKKPYTKNKKKILIHHLQPNTVNPKEEKKNGYDKVLINTVFETTRIPSSWIPFINQSDGLLVPSTQNKKAFEDSGVNVPIYLYPHGSDTNSFNPKNKKFPLGLENTFNFLSVFKWEHRKAPDVLLRAFWEEFSSRDKVSLIIKSSWGNGKSKSNQRAIINQIINYKKNLNYSDTAEIYFSPGFFSEDDIKGLYTVADCFVLPSRGEGVGLPYIEALSSGIPVISTNWGGQVDFLNKKNSYLVDYELKPTNYNNGYQIAPVLSDIFTPDMEWAEPSVDDLRKKMRYAYGHRNEVKEKGKQGRKDMMEMNWDKSALILKNIIEKEITNYERK